MAKTFEYPPAFARHHPFQYERHAQFPSMLRLRHHFLLTRLKLALHKMFELEFNEHVKAGVQNDTVLTQCLFSSVI